MISKNLNIYCLLMNWDPSTCFKEKRYTLKENSLPSSSQLTKLTFSKDQYRLLLITQTSREGRILILQSSNVNRNYVTEVDVRKNTVNVSHTCLSQPILYIYIYKNNDVVSSDLVRKSARYPLRTRALTYNKVDVEKPLIQNLKFHVVNRQLNKFTKCDVTV